MKLSRASAVLFCADLDRTLLPNGPAPESPEARPLLAAVSRREEFVPVYVSGRDGALIRQAVAEYALPLPLFAVGDVGATIYRIEGGEWMPRADWIERLEADWQGATLQDLTAALGGFEGMRMQESEKLGRFKLSYYVEPSIDLDELAASVRARLEGSGARVNIVVSHDESTGTGLLDVLPAGADKLQALRFLIEREELDPERAVFAGDSGNDLAVLTSELRSTLVANAQPAVREAAVGGARAHGWEERLYLARGGWLGMNGNYAAGALEGMAHFLPETGEWLRRARAAV